MGSSNIPIIRSEINQLENGKFLFQDDLKLLKFSRFSLIPFCTIAKEGTVSVETMQYMSLKDKM